MAREYYALFTKEKQRWKFEFMGVTRKEISIDYNYYVYAQGVKETKKTMRILKIAPTRQGIAWAIAKLNAE